MGLLTTGTVVLVRFPFSDLSRTKLRPAVVVADAGRGDWVLCQITSKPYGDPSAIYRGFGFRFGIVISGELCPTGETVHG